MEGFEEFELAKYPINDMVLVFTERARYSRPVAEPTNKVPK